MNPAQEFDSERTTMLHRAARAICNAHPRKEEPLPYARAQVYAHAAIQVFRATHQADVCPPGWSPLRELSLREVQVLKLIALGCSNEEIGKKLSISPNTAKVHARKIHKALGTGRQGHMIAVAFSCGLLTVGEMAHGMDGEE